MSALPSSSSYGHSSAAAIAASLAPAGTKRRFADPEYIAISEFLSSVGEVDEQDAHSGLPSSSLSSQVARKNDVAVVAAALQHKRARSDLTPRGMRDTTNNHTGVGKSRGAFRAILKLNIEAE